MNTQPVVTDFDEELFGFDWLAELDREPFEDVEEFKYDPSQARAPEGSATGGQWVSARTARAIDTHISMTKEKRARAERYEATVAKLIGGKNLDDNEPFDVIVGRHAVEVKVVLSGKHSKVTMHPESLARKANFLRDEGMTGHTVVIDAREDKPVYYYKRGVGSFRLSAMHAVKSEELKGLIA